MTLRPSPEPPGRAPVGSIRERSRRFQGDGTSGGSPDDLFGWSPCSVPLDSTIYVSASDPLGQSAFKPSPTKPLPRWMALLPSRRPDAMPWDERPASLLDDYFPRPPPQKARGSRGKFAKRVTFCPSPQKVWRKGRASPYQPLNESRFPATAHSTQGSSARPWSSRSLSVVSTEPLLRPSSRQRWRRTDTTTGSSAYETPPETPLPSSLRPALASPSTRQHQTKTRQPTAAPPIKPGPLRPAPAPRSPPSPVAVQAVATIRRLSKPPQLPRPPILIFDPATPETAARNMPIANRIPLRLGPTPTPLQALRGPAAPLDATPARSSEFLDRYAAAKPARSAVASPRPAARPVTTDAGGGGAVPVIGNVRPHSKGTPSAGVVSLETAKASPGRGVLGGKNYGGGRGLGERDCDGGQRDGTIDRRRQSVADELRRLFAEW